MKKLTEEERYIAFMSDKRIISLSSQLETISRNSVPIGIRYDGIFPVVEYSDEVTNLKRLLVDQIKEIKEEYDAL